MNSTLELRKIALEIFHRTLGAIDVESVVRASVGRDGDHCQIGGETIDLSRFKRLVVIVIGKAGVPMARAVEDLLGDRISDGLVATNAMTGQSPRRLPVIVG